MKQFDFIVLGSGIAGLSFALKVAPRGRVAIVTKKHRAESNTNYAQGGIAAVTSKEDSFESHVRDTLVAGAGLCKEGIVRTIVQEGPARVQELIELGMRFSEREVGGSSRTRSRQGRRAFQTPHSSREGCDRARNRARVARRRRRAAEHRDFRKPFRHRSDHHAETGTRRGQSLPRRLRAGQQNGRSRDIRGVRRAARHRRLRKSLSLHDESRHRDGRRRGDGVSRGRDDCRTWNSSNSIRRAFIIRRRNHFSSPKRCAAKAAF